MGGKRVFVSGVGGELGTLVATLLEREDWVGALSGQRRWSAGIKAWEARRKQRRETEAGLDMRVRGDTPPGDQPPRGPWG